MSLYTRLIGPEVVGGVKIPRVPAEVFLALAAQVVRNEITAATAGNILGLSASERTEAAAIVAKVGTGPGQYSREKLQDILNIASWAGNTSTYKTEAALKSALGIP